MAWMVIISPYHTVFPITPDHKNVAIHMNNRINKYDDIKDKNNFKIGYGKTATFLLPEEISNLVIHEKMELGDADDKVFKRVNSKHGGGTVGILTNGLIDRSDFYQHALKLALVSTFT